MSTACSLPGSNTAFTWNSISAILLDFSIKKAHLYYILLNFHDSKSKGREHGTGGFYRVARHGGFGVDEPDEGRK
jgi:hypothetical protein